jgi:hypothetical protein
MEEQKDIGKLFKQHFNEAEVSAPEKSWEQINEALDKKERRRKRFFWLWFTVIGLVGLSGIYFGLIQNNDNESTDHNTEITTEIDDSESIKQEIIVKEEKENVGKSGIDSLDAISAKDKDQQEPVAGKSEKNSDAFIDSFTEVKTTYYYFRSSDEQKIITNDKNRVDSLINAYNEAIEVSDSLTDNIPLKKKDSF